MPEMECTGCGRMGSRDDGMAIGDDCIECGGELLWSGLIGFQTPKFGELSLRDQVNQILEEPLWTMFTSIERSLASALSYTINVIDKAYLENDLTDADSSSGADNAQSFFDMLTALGYEVA